MRNRRYILTMVLCLLVVFPSISSEVGDNVITISNNSYLTKPASAYNPVNSEVLIVWSEGKAGCANNIVLKGQFIDYQTGTKKGATFQIYEATSNCESSLVEIPEMVYDPSNNQYFIIVKTIQGGFKKVVGFMINENGVKTSTEVELASSTFGDPYQKFIAAYDPLNQKIIIGYHVQTGTSEMSLHLQKINPANGQKDGSEVIYDKNTVNIPGTKGPKGSVLSFNTVANKWLLVFHADNATTSEIWGIHLNPSTLALSGSFFQISPNGTSDNQYKNPALALNTATNEFLVVFEDVDLATTEYEQAANILAQKISSSDGSKIGTSKIISKIGLGGCGTCIEQAKLPYASYSAVKNEFLVSFYGTPTSSGLENYNIYGSRIDPSSLDIIETESFLIAAEKGTSVVTNNSLQPITIQYFNDTDKYLYAWLDQVNGVIESQLRKYENHIPTDIILSVNQVNENAGLNTLVGILSTEDFDDDDAFNYALVAGNGDTNNSFFKITGNELRVKVAMDFETDPDKSIRIRSVDSFGEMVEKIFQITILDVNEQPSNISISNSSIDEYMPKGTFVGKLSSSDQDNGDTHTYQVVAGSDLFYIQNDSLFSNSVFEFNQGSTVNITIKTIDNGGLEFSKNFTIEIIEFPDFEDPKIIQENFIDTYLYRNPSERVSIKATDDTGIKIVNFYCRPVSSEEWTITPVSGTDDLYEASIPKTSLDETGMVYFFEVSDIKNYVYSDTVVMNINFEDGDFILDNLNFGGKEDDYQIIAIPFQLENPSIKSNFEDDLGIQNVETWRILHYASGTCCSEYPTTLQNFERGKGYWFNQKQNNTIDLGAGQVSFDSLTEYFEIELEAGWNQIGNPYPFDIDWTKVISFSENESLFQTGIVSNSLYVFEQGGFGKQTTLPAFRGAFLNTEQASTLKIPFAARSEENGRTANTKVTNPISEDHWEVTILLNAGQKNFNYGGIGMHPEASSSKDKYDELLVPRFGRYMDYHFAHQEYFYPYFAKDIVPTNDNYTWEFTVSSSESKTSTLSWDNSYFGRNDKRLILIDLESGNITDMSAIDSYEFELIKDKTFRVVFGGLEFVNAELTKLNGNLGVAYPNPFDNQLNIPLTLPVIDQSLEIEFLVYNNLGERIFTSRQSLHRNHNLLQWNGTSNDGKNIDTGIYFYKVVITKTGKSFTGKVVKH